MSRPAHVPHPPVPTMDALLRLILTSRVYDVCRETPLDAGAAAVCDALAPSCF